MDAPLQRRPPGAEGVEVILQALHDVGVPHVEGPHQPLFTEQVIAAGLVNRQGALIWASPAFMELGGEAVVDPEMVARVAAGAAPLTTVTALPQSEETAAFAYALASRTSGWRLPPEMAETAAANPGSVVVLSGNSARTPPLEAACRAYGLTGLQTRVALATIRSGHVRNAATDLGLSYYTAREALTEALARVNVRRLPALVQRLTSLAFGVLPAEDETDVLGNLWGLSPRQASIAGLVCDGLSRGETAATLGITEAVVRKELETIYLILQVDSAAALARRLVEARALDGLTRATAGDLGYLEPAAEPLRLIARPDGGRIAISDYGPVSGRPLVVTHPIIWTRIVPRRTVRALQAAGWRPIAVDRPGFGLTDEALGPCWEAGAVDVVTVLDALKVRRAEVLATQGGAQLVMALARLAPERMGRVVLVNPDPPSTASRSKKGTFGIMKDAWMRYPGLIRLVVATMAKQMSYEFMVDGFGRASRGSPADEAAYRDPEMSRDIFLAMRPLATGRFEGLIKEEVAIARGGPEPPIADTADWTVLLGLTDTMHDPHEVAAYFRPVLPQARFELLEDCGRLLSMTHPQHVVDALGT